MSIINDYEGFIFDLDGTIYLDDVIIPNADKVINKIKDSGKKVVYISNKTTGSACDYYNFLKSKNINIESNEVVNATIITKKFLNDNFSNKKFYAIGEDKFIDEISEGTLSLSKNSEEIDIVLITLDRTLNYEKLEIAAKALDNGAKFFAANIDNTCPVEGGEILDAGATISALEKRTNRQLEINFGKPSKFMLDEALARLKVEPQKCLIIGDRLETDIAMGNLFQIDTALVSSGVSNQQNFIDTYKPTYKINTVNNLIS